MEKILVLDAKNYPEDRDEIYRISVRGIIFVNDKLLLIENDFGEVKLPGGGMEAGENEYEALVREVKEETGFDVKPESIKPFGEIEEKRLSMHEDMIWHQISRLYFCDVHPRQGQCAYTENEKKYGFRQVFYTLDEAIKKNEVMLQREGEKAWNRREYKTLKLIREYLRENEKLVSIVPSKRQLAFQQLEFYAFVHFTVNTYTDREWGDGTENPSIFNPIKLDPNQWVKAVKEAGMKGLILTCKHHDGFCLWPSKYTNHSVKSSPYKEGKADVVLEVANACKAHGIKFGVYLSPWDRNCALYGQGKAYDDYFVNQLTELLTGYGDVFSVWFDGACGEGPNGKKQYYDWPRYYETIRRLQPEACISVCGPDIRWCGNEAGDTREAEWSVVPLRTRDSEIVAENCQQEDNAEFRQRRIDARDRDLGSRERLKGEEDLIWYPAEVNTSIRPGWFYHESENGKVRSSEELFQIYLNSVGGNATFLLNIPPTKEGLFHEEDVKRLGEIGKKLRKAFQTDLTGKAVLSANGKNVESLRVDSYDQSFYGNETGVSILDVTFEEATTLDYLILKENILFSQRVEKFLIEACVEERLVTVYEGTVIGYKRIVPLGGICTNQIRVRITECRKNPILSYLGIYQEEKENETGQDCCSG